MLCCGSAVDEPEDVALMRDLGIKAYRMSIAWSRVIPQGTGKPNPKGLAFYDKLFDALLAADVCCAAVDAAGGTAVDVPALCAKAAGARPSAAMKPAVRIGLIECID